MINYINEHTWAGQLGHGLVLAGLTTALLSVLAYALAANNKGPQSLKRIGRAGFAMHAISMLGVAGLLFWMLINQYFEYDYVWKHSNSTMPLRYIFSCFWEGQEGSFLLWIFWHIVLGGILLRKAGEWEAPVMAVFALVQVFLVSMLLGIYVGDHRIGSSPFILIRQLPENVGLPWTMMSNYLETIPAFQDGRGLNPLLQNYWMTIHPPTLFLGFAAVLVPFAFAVAGLWTKKLTQWIDPALPWTYFAVGALGLGILMGGAWAYEALSFGGFWAWDPVENASLVPWLVLAGGAHVMLVNRRKKHSLFTAYFLILTAFILVLYSTFLTRSGVLGDTSVHSFTGDGMIGQLLLYLLFFVALSTTLLVLDKKLRVAYALSSLLLLVLALWSGQVAGTIAIFLLVSVFTLLRGYQKHFPKEAKEEELWSREFWMFIGAIVLVLSSVQITFETSKPVWNLLAAPFSGGLMSLYNATGINGLKALAEGSLAPQSNVIQHYNKWQIPFAFILLTLMAVGQFFRYKDTPMRKWMKDLALSAGVALGLTMLVFFTLGFANEHFTWTILLLTALFAVTSNIDYLFRMLRGKMALAGASVAHVGFALIMLGALISAGMSTKISRNTTGVNIEALGETMDNATDVLLFKGDTVQMNRYFIHYKEKFREGVNMYYEVEYFHKQSQLYRTGDLVFSQGGVFRALQSHTASANFLLDQENWEFVGQPTTQEMERMKLWRSEMPAEPAFVLNPRVQVNPTFGNVAEPATRHYIHKDIYTHVKWAELEDPDVDSEGYMPAAEHIMHVGDTVKVSIGTLRLDSIVVLDEARKEAARLFTEDLVVEAVIKIKRSKGSAAERNTILTARPLFILRGNNLQVPDYYELEEAGLKFVFESIDPRNGTFTILVAEKLNNRREFIVMQAIVFPGINILWIGCILMVLGTFMAVRQRIKINRKRTLSND